MQGMNRDLTKAIGFISGIVGATMWGFSGVCSQYLFATSDITSEFLTMVRAIAAALFFAVVIAAKYREVPRKLVQEKHQVRRLVLFGFALFGSQIFYVITVSLTNAGTATVLQLSYMIFILGYTTVKAKALPAPRELLSFLCALGGVILIATQGDLTSLSLPAAGLIFGLINGLSVALYVTLPKPLFATYGSFPVTGLGMAINAVLAIAVWVGFQMMAPSSQAWLIPTLDTLGWFVLIGGIGFVGTFLSYALYLHGVAKVGAVTGGLLGAFEPLGAMVISALWLGTIFSGADWAGFVLMIVMLVLLTIPAKQK